MQLYTFLNCTTTVPAVSMIKVNLKWIVLNQPAYVSVMLVCWCIWVCVCLCITEIHALQQQGHNLCLFMTVREHIRSAGWELHNITHYTGGIIVLVVMLHQSNSMWGTYVYNNYSAILFIIPRAAQEYWILYFAHSSHYYSLNLRRKYAYCNWSTELTYLSCTL